MSRFQSKMDDKKFFGVTKQIMESKLFENLNLDFD